MNKQWTKKQHFVPRMILKHHTYFQIPMRKPIIYQYDKEKDICRTVDIYDICRKDNLYEFRNEDGSIKESTRNAIENTLSWYESSWDKIFNKILSHQELTETDFAFLYLLFAVQILRLPDVQKVGVQLYKDFTKDIEHQFTDTDIENWVKYASLPTGAIDDNQTILKGFVERLGKKELTICNNDLWVYFQEVIGWAKRMFPNMSKKLIECQDWGILYNKYRNKQYNTNEMRTLIDRLLQDEDVTKQTGIISYVLSDRTKHDEKYLSIRAFSEQIKRRVYERQGHKCPFCVANGVDTEYAFEEMQGDHIIPWSQGGRTVEDNCQMLCQRCNNDKSAQ